MDFKVMAAIPLPDIKYDVRSGTNQYGLEEMALQAKLGLLGLIRHMSWRFLVPAVAKDQ